MNETQTQRYQIRIEDRESHLTRIIQLSPRGLRLLAGGAAAVLVLVTAGAVLSVYTLMHSYEGAAEKRDLRDVNRIQQEQILRVSKKASALADELDSLRRSEDSLRAIVGAPTAADAEAAPASAAPTGGAPHALTTEEVDEALEMLETRIEERRSSLDLLARTMSRSFPGAAAYISAGAPQTIPAGWPTEGYISSPYGLRFQGTEFHQGVDIAADVGTPIVATADGVVRAAGWTASGYGNMVDIDHGGGIMTRYGHASAVAVAAGQEVRRGQIIAYVGSTGYSTGPHLHYEVRVGGQPVNPASYMSQ